MELQWTAISSATSEEGEGKEWIVESLRLDWTPSIAAKRTRRTTKTAGSYSRKFDPDVQALRSAQENELK